MKKYLDYIKTNFTKDNNFCKKGFAFTFDIEGDVANFPNLETLNNIAKDYDQYLLTDEDVAIDAKWLLSDAVDDQLDGVKLHWRSSLGLSEDLYEDVPLSNEARCNLALAKFKEEGVELTSAQDLMLHLVKEGLSTPEISFQQALTNLGIPETEPCIVADKGYIGANHGRLIDMMQNNSHTLFHHPEFVNNESTYLTDIDKLNNIRNDRLGYYPNPFSLTLQANLLTPAEKVGYLTLTCPQTGELMMDLASYFAGEDSNAKAFMENRYEATLTPELTLEYLKTHNYSAPSFIGHPTLILLNFDPILDYGKEVLSMVSVLKTKIEGSEVKLKTLTVIAVNSAFTNPELSIKLIDELTK